MQSRALSFRLRVACAIVFSTLSMVGPIGCDGGSAPATGTKSELPPEARKANENMENFMKKGAEKK